MSLDCPVITSEVPGAREQFGDAALYFPPTDERELAERLAELLGSKELRRRMVQRGRARAKLFTVEDYAKSVLALLDEFALIARAWERCDSQFT